MKKIGISFFTFALTVFLFVPQMFIYVHADNNNYSSVDASVFYIEYSSREIIVPLLDTQEGQSYTFDVFEENDLYFAYPIERGDFSFVPDKLGTFIVRYRLNDKGRDVYSYKTLILTDTSKPTFELSLEDSYDNGKTIEVSPKIFDNTSHWSTISYTLTRDGKDVSSLVIDGKITLKDNGEYKLRVKVTDAGGNSSAQTYKFSVVSGKNNEGCNGIVAGDSALLIVTAIVGFFILKLKGNNSEIIK